MFQRSSTHKRGGITRRDFFLTTAAGLAATSAVCMPFGNLTPALGARRRRTRGTNTPEALIAELYASLNRQQYSAVVFPFNDPRRRVVTSDWCICGHHIDRIFDRRPTGDDSRYFLGPARAALCQTGHGSGRTR